MAAEAGTTEGRTVPGGWAQPPQGPGERPLRIPRPVRVTPPGLGRHIPRRTPPREHALDRRLNRCGRLCRCSYCLHRRLSWSWLARTLSTATDNRRRVPCPLRPARPRPRAHGPAPRDSSAAGEQARAHLPPTPPTASLGRPRPVPPPHVTASKSTACACADPPHFLRPRRPRPNFSASPYGKAGNSLRLSLYWRGMSQCWGRKLWVCDRSCRFPANTEVLEGWLGW
ncbi:sentrin-specific protease 8 isoform X2 [Callithrix jacchus]